MFCLAKYCSNHFQGLLTGGLGARGLGKDSDSLGPISALLYTCTLSQDGATHQPEAILVPGGFGYIRITL